MGLGDNWVTKDDPATPAQISHATTLAKQLGQDQQATEFMQKIEAAGDEGVPLPPKAETSKFIYYGRKKLGLE